MKVRETGPFALARQTFRATGLDPVPSTTGGAARERREPFLILICPEPMTEAEWLACTDPTQMLEFLRRTGSYRKLRLFAVGCCRRVWTMLEDERSRDAVEVAERFADGLATEKERAAAWLAAHNATEARRGVAFAASNSALSKVENRSWCSRAASAAEAARIHDGKEPQADLLRCIFGNPFHPSTVERSLLTESVFTLASAIYEERAFDRLPILADALEESGCRDAAILAHCRGPGPHVRGCWVVDLLLHRK